MPPRHTPSSAASLHTEGVRELAELLRGLRRRAPQRWWTAAELLAKLSGRAALEPARALRTIRAAAQSSRALGPVAVHGHGQGRGRRYAFSAKGEPAPTAPDRPTAQALLQAYAPPAAPSGPSTAGTIELWAGDNLELLPHFADGSFDLIYIDPPFNTGRTQRRTRTRSVRDDGGDRLGFTGQRYRTELRGASHYLDAYDDYLAFLLPRLEQAKRLLTPRGSLFVHLDCREVHYVKVALDQLFGREHFINELIWAYDYGARATRRWSAKHDNILWYARDPQDYCFNFEAIDRIPYMAPGLVGLEKAERGKTPTDTWWHTIVSPTGREKTGYPTQKPLGILRRIVAVHSAPGDRVLDFFAGSGSFGEAAASLGRHAVLIDNHDDALAIMRSRFSGFALREPQRAR